MKISKLFCTTFIILSIAISPIFSSVNKRNIKQVITENRKRNINQEEHNHHKYETMQTILYIEFADLMCTEWIANSDYSKQQAQEFIRESEDPKYDAHQKVKASLYGIGDLMNKVMTADQNELEFIAAQYAECYDTWQKNIKEYSLSRINK